MFFVMSDIIITVFSLYFSFFLRFDFVLREEYRGLIIEALPLFIIVKLSIFLGFRLCRIRWKYVGLHDLMNIAAALTVSEGILAFLILFPVNRLIHYSGIMVPTFGFQEFPRSVFLIDWTNSLILLFTIRISKRLCLEIFHKNGGNGKGVRTLIIGAGNAGEMILRDMSRHAHSAFNPVGLIDDDRNKVGTYIHGVKVLGTSSGLKKIILANNVKAAIIAIPSLSQKTLRGIYDAARESGIETIKIIPRIYDFNRPDINLKSLEEIKIEDLIGRQAVEVDNREIMDSMKGKVVVVTGAGGSIGSEITMQVCAGQPGHVVLFDIDETELHNMELRLRKTFPHFFNGDTGRDNTDKISFVVGDVRDRSRVNSVFRAFKPGIVFHAAAYKHVPMMEYNPYEAVKVNMFGSYTVAEASVSSGVKKFVLISTDKAVRPTSVMGATKRMAEYICKAFNGCGQTEFVSVRFGNVLGSRGSVLPLFLEQLKNGRPLTVTHKDMKRYFMTIPEAVSLVLQASVIGKGGNVLVLDMGEPVRIVDLAEDLIRINGLEPYKDVDIEFIEPRPGEKLFEEILTAEEGTIASKHQKIFISRNTESYSKEEINAILKEFESQTEEQAVFNDMRVKELLKKYVRHFDEFGEADLEEGFNQSERLSL